MWLVEFLDILFGYTYGFFLTSVKSNQQLCIELSSFLTKEQKVLLTGYLRRKKPKTLR